MEGEKARIAIRSIVSLGRIPPPWYYSIFTLALLLLFDCSRFVAMEDAKRRPVPRGTEGRRPRKKKPRYRGFHCQDMGWVKFLPNRAQRREGGEGCGHILRDFFPVLSGYASGSPRPPHPPRAGQVRGLQEHARQSRWVLGAQLGLACVSCL